MSGARCRDLRLFCQNSLPPLCPQPRGDENPFPKAEGPRHRFMAAERSFPTAVSEGCVLSLVLFSLHRILECTLNMYATFYLLLVS